LSQDEKQQHDGRRVQQDIRDVVPAGVAAVHLPIEHVGDAGQRDPVVRQGLRESRLHPVRAETVGNLGIPVDALVIVDVDELVAGRPSECQSNRQQQQHADGQHAAGSDGPKIGEQRALVSSRRPLHDVLSGTVGRSPPAGVWESGPAARPVSVSSSTHGTIRLASPFCPSHCYASV
jgi:hypothetical protein